jgi:hypothetical protein
VALKLLGADHRGILPEGEVVLGESVTAKKHYTSLNEHTIRDER